MNTSAAPEPWDIRRCGEVVQRKGDHPGGCFGNRIALIRRFESGQRRQPSPTANLAPRGHARPAPKYTEQTYQPLKLHQVGEGIRGCLFSEDSFLMRGYVGSSAAALRRSWRRGNIEGGAADQC